ncbi:MAG: hypothetical protein AB7I98_02570 [Verrucomicrobiales bacterium]|nr:hypothetical protein [Verrucomicrobiae bacterium]
MADAVNYPDFPETPIYFKDVDKVNKGRYATLELNINTDGNIRGHFTVENMQALVGCHISGHYDLFDNMGNLIARVKMPNLGLQPAWISIASVRHHDFEGKIKSEELGRVRRIDFTGYEEPTFDQLEEIMKVIKEDLNIFE